MKLITVCLACLCVQQESDGVRPRTQEPADRQQQTVFSGPQKGEKLPPLSVRLVGAEKQTDIVAAGGDGPIMLVFFHKLTRPAFALTRALGQFAAMDQNKKLHSAVVFLVEDETAAETRIKAITSRMPKPVKVGISPDGLNGPGAYGLNRNVTLTVLVANKGRVVANYALVQPSAQADGPKIMKSVVDVVGGRMPNIESLLATQRMVRMDPKIEQQIRPLLNRKLSDDEVDRRLKELEKYVAEQPQRKQMLARMAAGYAEGDRMAAIPNEKVRVKVAEWAKSMRRGRRPNANAGRTPAEQQDPQIRVLMRPFIQKTATDEEVAAAAKKIEDYAAAHPKAKGQIGDICRRIIVANKLSNYGTAKCQEYMKKWAVDFQPAASQRGQKTKRSDKNKQTQTEEADRGTGK